MNLASTDHLYDFATGWVASNSLVENESIERLSHGVGDLIRAVGDDAREAYWTAILRHLRALRWRLATVPLPVNSRSIGVSDVAEIVVPQLRRSEAIAPDHSGQANRVADMLEHLWACAEDPLGVAVKTLLDNAEGSAILLVDGRHARAVSDAFLGIPAFTGAELARTHTRAVIAVGPSAWFPPRVLRAPRARRFAFVRYAWIRDRCPDLNLIVGSTTRVRQALRETPAIARHTRYVDPGELVPEIEWTAINRAIRRAPSDAVGEPVEARLFLLASGQGVYFETRDRARANVAEMDEDLSVRQALVADLSPGDFVVVRTEEEGDEDYVRVYADQLLGGRADTLRALQKRIKARLNNEIQHFGAGAVAKKLRRLGSPIASEGNVRRWADPANIKTRDYADFAAICELIGETEPKTLWAAMDEIWKAHIHAGSEVRKLLLAELQKADLSTLLQDGWGDYEVEEIDGEGALRVARITGRAPESTAVARSRLRKAFNIRSDLWLG